MLEYPRSIKLMAESTAEVQISFYGIQVCCGNHSYLLLTCHWTWRYITITNSWVFSLQLLCTHWPTYTYLLTITLVIYLVLSLYLALTNARVAHTITYLYFVYLLWNNYRILLSRLHFRDVKTSQSSHITWCFMVSVCTVSLYNGAYRMHPQYRSFRAEALRQRQRVLAFAQSGR